MGQRVPAAGGGSADDARAGVLRRHGRHNTPTPQPLHVRPTQALILMSAADLCFLAVFIRGGIIWRIVAVVASLPSVLVIEDFLRRAACWADEPPGT